MLEHHVTQKNTIVIDYNKKKRKNLREETRFTRIHCNLVAKSTIMTSEDAVNYKSIDKCERKKSFFRKQFSKFELTN